MEEIDPTILGRKCRTLWEVEVGIEREVEWAGGVVANWGRVKIRNDERAGELAEDTGRTTEQGRR